MWGFILGDEKFWNWYWLANIVNILKTTILYTLKQWILCYINLCQQKYFLFFYCCSVFLNIFIDYAITVVPFPTLHSTPSCTPLPPTFPPYPSCPWVTLVSSLASTFPTLFLPSPVYLLPTIYATYSLYLSPLSPPPTPLLITLLVISISVVLFLF